MEIARKAANLTKQKLEEEAGLASGYVSRITRDQQGGKRPGADTVAALARALGVEEAWLRTGSGAGPGQPRGTLRVEPLRPNLDQAVTLLRREGQVSPEVVAHVRDTTHKLGELDLATWIQVLADIQRRR